MPPGDKGVLAAMRDLVDYGERHPKVVWPGNSRIAVSITVHFEEGAELTPLEGDDFPEIGTNPIESRQKRRELGLESMYEYGARRGFWRLMEIFDRAEVKVTFLCAGQALERNRVAAREIMTKGHEVCGHGYRWIPYHGLSREEVGAHIRRAVESIRNTTGERPLGWNSRTPSVHVRELLMEEDFLYDSDSYNDDLPYFLDVNGRKFLTIPYAMDANDEKFSPPPLVAGFSEPGNFLNALKATFDRLYLEGLTDPKMMSVALHLRISGRPSRASQVASFIRYAKEFPEVWFARRIDIARWWIERYSSE